MTSASSHSVGASKKPDDVAVVVRSKSRDEHVEPTLYSSVIETEFKLKQISQSRLEPKLITNQVRLNYRRYLYWKCVCRLWVTVMEKKNLFYIPIVVIHDNHNVIYGQRFYIRIRDLTV